MPFSLSQLVLSRWLLRLKVRKDQFVVSILEELKYSPDEPQADYTEDLEILKSVRADKLAAENIAPYH